MDKKLQPPAPVPLLQGVPTLHFHHSDSFERLPLIKASSVS
jgi:hypothetical protein